MGCNLTKAASKANAILVKWVVFRFGTFDGDFLFGNFGKKARHCLKNRGTSRNYFDDFLFPFLLVKL